MEKIIERTFNVETNEVVDIERNETAAEKAERQQWLAENAAIKAETDAKALARKTITDRLGLTAEEAALLLS